MPEFSPKVSVVLPFYNAEKTLSVALQSIASQEFPDWECIMVNNNSRDKSREIAAYWEEKDPRFRLIDEEKQAF